MHPTRPQKQEPNHPQASGPSEDISQGCPWPQETETMSKALDAKFHQLRQRVARTKDPAVLQKCIQACKHYACNPEVNTEAAKDAARRLALKASEKCQRLLSSQET